MKICIVPEDFIDESQPLVITLSINIFLAVAAILGSTPILITLQKKTLLHAPSKRLFSCLVTTDMCVGLVSQPNAVLYFDLVDKGTDALCDYSPLSENFIGLLYDDFYKAPTP